MAYVEREAAMKELMNDAPEQVGYSREDAADCIRYMDAADVAPVRHGRWELHYEVINGELIPSDKKHVCSECKDIWETSSKLNYCPNCGAKMDGGEPDA